MTEVDHAPQAKRRGPLAALRRRPWPLKLIFDHVLLGVPLPPGLSFLVAVGVITALVIGVAANRIMAGVLSPGDIIIFTA
jgi:hypothetical protein